MNLSDEEIIKRSEEKKRELEEIFKHVSLATNDATARVAILGCGDKRFIKHHNQMFEELLRKPVELTTFDISIEHLAGEENVFQHDCTLPIPNPPYNITFAHVLLKFIETEKQWDLIKNSVDALKEGGLAIHVFDKEDYETKERLLSNGQFAVPLHRWEQELQKLGFKFIEVYVKYGLALVVKK